MALDIKAAQLRREDEYNRDVQLAWNILRIELLTMKPNGRRELPAMHTLLLGYTPKVLTKADVRAQQLNVFKDLSARYGITLRTKES